MGLFMPSFKDITMKTETMEAHIGLSVFGWRFSKAQKWMDEEFLRLMEPYVPYRTGAFLARIKNANAGRVGTGSIRVAVPPQGKKLYPGVNYNGVPFHWTNPKTQPFWGQFVVRTYRHEITKGVKDIILGRK